MSNMINIMRDMSRKTAEARAKKPILDAAGDAPAALVGADDFTLRNIALTAVAAIQQWAETDASELDSGETMADRLMALMIGTADANKDGELTEDENGVLNVALNVGWDYLTKMGVAEEDASALLNDWDTDAADRVKELVVAALPEGDKAAAADMDSFVFGPGDQEPMLDGAIFKKVIAFVGGVKKRINKHIAGVIRHTAKQKVAIRKMLMKSHSAAAQMKRAKSMRARAKAGL